MNPSRKARSDNRRFGANPDSSHDSAWNPQLAFPPRYWWLKRILAATAVLLVALLVVHWWWGLDARRKLDAKIAEYRALGQPVMPEDFKLPPIPDEENAAHFLKQAAAKIVQPANVNLNFEDLCGDLEQIKIHADDVHRILDANLEAFALAGQALHFPIADWNVQVTAQIWNLNFPDITLQRRLSKLLGTAVLYHHVAGDDFQSMQRLQQFDFQALHVTGRQLCLIQLLTHTGMFAAVAYSVEQIAPTLQIGSAENAPQRASPKQVRALIASLLAEDEIRESWRQAFYFERLFSVNSVKDPVANIRLVFGPASRIPLLTYGIIPALQHDALFTLDFNARVSEAGVSLNYPQTMREMPVYPAMGGIQRMAHFTSRIMLPSFDRTTVLYFRGIALRRMAALALALRLYEVEHGNRPATLEALDPDYLPAIPLDPFAAENTPIRYLPDAPHPLLYSINDDEIDDGGRVTLNGKGDVYREKSDLIFFLDGQRPQSPPPTVTTAPAASKPANPKDVEDDAANISLDKQR